MPPAADVVSTIAASGSSTIKDKYVMVSPKLGPNPGSTLGLRHPDRLAATAIAQPPGR